MVAVARLNPVALSNAQATNRSRLIVGDLQFDIHRSARRRTLQITVERDGKLLLSAPPDVSEQTLRTFAMEKRFWIYTRLARKELLHRKLPRKEYIDGEGFLYLGRSYRLKLVEDQDIPLKLVEGRFFLQQDCASNARQHFMRWYSERARPWLAGRVADWQSRMDLTPAGVKVQDLGYRWGSCGKGSWLYFHWKCILLPAHIAEYIVVHELAHLQAPLHTTAFWLLVERAMPDFARRKAWLAEHGIDVEGV
jgi:predicted metal-dependent hydrolase